MFIAIYLSFLHSKNGKKQRYRFAAELLSRLKSSPLNGLSPALTLIPTAHALQSSPRPPIVAAVVKWFHARSTMGVGVEVTDPSRRIYEASFMPPGNVKPVLPLKAPSRIFFP